MFFHISITVYTIHGITITVYIQIIRINGIYFYFKYFYIVGINKSSYFRIIISALKIIKICAILGIVTTSVIVIYTI